MKIIIFTNYTSHHLYFVQRLIEKFPISLIVNEDSNYRPGFEVRHEFELLRDDYEKQAFFQGRLPRFQEYQETLKVDNINDHLVLKSIQSIKPDVILVFGTGLIKSDIINSCPNGIVNLHGGDIERYRGLDSHYWTIYHEDFDYLVTTLHGVEKEFDTGPIIRKCKIELNSKMELFQLRSHNTEKCIELCLGALSEYEQKGSFSSSSIRDRGRYYSFMPTTLKEVCLRKFKKYVKML